MAHFLFYLLIGAFYLEVSRRSFQENDHPRGTCELCIAFLHVGLAIMTADFSTVPNVPLVV